MSDRCEKCGQMVPGERDDHIAQNEDGSITVILRVPVTTKLGDKIEQHTEITLRKARTKDLGAMHGHGSEFDNSFAFVTSLANVPKKVIEELHPFDWRVVNQAAQLFFVDPMVNSAS